LQLFTLYLSGAYSAAFAVIGSPYNLNNWGARASRSFNSWFKRLDRNNVTALKSCPRAETATMLGHIFHECLFVERMSSSSIPVDFNRDF